MELVIVAVLVAVAILVVIADSVRRRSPARADNPLQAQRAAAEAEMEEHDIDDMLDAINERRRRRGARDVGEELEDELRRASWEDE